MTKYRQRYIRYCSHSYGNDIVLKHSMWDRVDVNSNTRLHRSSSVASSELSVGRVDPRVGSGRVQSLCVSIFCLVAVFWRHIRNGGRQLHNYNRWLVTKGCMPTILKCEETLCVEQLDTVVYSHYDDDTILTLSDVHTAWYQRSILKSIVSATRIIRLVARVTQPSALCELFCAIGK